MRRALQTALVFSITGLLLMLFVQGADLADVWTQIVGADLPLLLSALIVSSTAYVLRARRWQFLLRPVGQTRFMSALGATVIGFTASFVLPGRTGEVLRPYLLARRDGLSATAAFATVVIERLLDLIGVLLLFAGFLLVADPAGAIRDASSFRALQLGGLATGSVALLAFFILVVVARYPGRTQAAIARVAAMLPHRLATRLNRNASTFVRGLLVLRTPGDAAIALVGAFPLWLCSILSIWCVSKAFDLGVPFSGAFPLLMLLVIGVSVPTPGGVGGVHYAFRFGATVLYGASGDRAIGAAIVLHALTVLPVTVAGLLWAAAKGLKLGSLRAAATTPTGVVDSAAAAQTKPEVNWLVENP